MPELADLHRVDMNLLVAFDTLAREKNVTRAAERAGVSQSAMSHTLKRLRDLFSDRLLVRGSGGMMLTPRAEALVVPIRASLSALAKALADPTPFEPSTARRTFTIASPDLFDALALPRLLARLARDAPRIDVVMTPIPYPLRTSLMTGDVDMAITAVLLESDPVALATETSPELRQRVLFRDTFRCYFRSGHPALARKRLTVRAYAALNHVLVSPRGEGPGLVDAYLREHALDRRIALRVPHFASAMAIARESDLVLTAPAALAEIAPDLASRPCPVPLPEHAITIMWHPRVSEDLGHRWLRKILLEEMQGRVTSRRHRSRRHR